MKELIGKTIINVREGQGNYGTEIVTFECQDGTAYELSHEQDCCENVYLQDRCGEWEEIIGTPILMAEEVSNMPEPEFKYDDDSHTWTFYRITTQKGQVVLRWLGESNGYYSEGVTFRKLGAC